MFLAGAGFVGFYLMAAGQAGTSELIAGGGAVLLTLLFSIALHDVRTRDLSLRAPWFTLLAHALAEIVRDTAGIGAVLLRTAVRGGGAGAGLITLQPFDTGRNDAADGGRRALVTLAASIAPNGYVLRILDQRHALALHRLSPAPTKPNRKWPL